MIYHGFYKEKVGWIGDAVAEGVHFLAGAFPLYAGLYISDFKNDEEIKQGIQLALKNGAHGVFVVWECYAWYFGDFEGGDGGE